MLIPLPILMFFSTLTGQPVTVIIVPSQLPAISVPAKKVEVESVGVCYSLVCKV